MERIRLMTHNVWNHDNNDPRWEERGEDCSAQARVGGLLRVYEDTMPDVIGGQEFTALMADLVKEGLDRAVMVRFSDTEHIQIWTIDNKNFHINDSFRFANM